jgi:hypothetical protein
LLRRLQAVLLAYISKTASTDEEVQQELAEFAALLR